MTEQELQKNDSLTESPSDEDTTLTDVIENSQSHEAENVESESDPQNESDSSKEDETPEPQEEEEEDDGIKRIRKLNNENKNLRNRLREAEDQLKNLGTDPDALKTLISERDSFKSQYDTLLSSLRTERLTNVMTDECRKAGAIEPNAVIALANTSDVAVVYDDNNKPTNVSDVIKNLKTKYPKLFGTQSFNGNAGARNERHADTDDLSPKERMRLGFAEK